MLRARARYRCCCYDIFITLPPGCADYAAYARLVIYAIDCLIIFRDIFFALRAAFLLLLSLLMSLLAAIVVAVADTLLMPSH